MIYNRIAQIAEVWIYGERETRGKSFTKKKRKKKELFIVARFTKDPYEKKFVKMNFIWIEILRT